MFRLTDRFVFRSLLCVRLLSAVYNIIHDCDEVYNYWEPLHRLLYGYGKQTWEYRYCCLTLYWKDCLNLVLSLHFDHTSTLSFIGWQSFQ